MPGDSRYAGFMIQSADYLYCSLPVSSAPPILRRRADALGSRIMSPAVSAGIVSPAGDFHWLG